MLRKSKIFVLITIPLLFAAISGFYFGNAQYIEELQTGNDSSDSMRWALIAGLMFSPIGFVIGLITDLFFWMISTKPKHLREKESSF